MMPQTIRKYPLPKRARVVRHTKSKIRSISDNELYELAKKEIGKLALLNLKTEELSSKLQKKNDVLKQINNHSNKILSTRKKPEIKKVAYNKAIVNKLSKEAEEIRKKKESIFKRQSIVQDNLNMIKEHITKKRLGRT